MLFLGQSSNYSKKASWRQLFVKGTEKDSDELRAYLADFYQVPKSNVILTANGRSAIAIALKKLLNPGDKVLVNGFTCHAVLEAIEAAKCEAIYADIERETLNYSPKELEKALKKHPDLKAIILQNTLGIPVEIEEFEKIVKKHHLIMIEDMAHAVGMKYKDGRNIGSVGDAAALSFGKSKQIDAITGGALIFRNQNVEPPKQPTEFPSHADNLRSRWYPIFGRIGRSSYKIHLNKIYYGSMIRLHIITRSGDIKLSFKTRPFHWQAKLALEQFKKLASGDNTPIRKHALVENRAKVLKELKKNGYNFDEIWYDAPVAPIRFYKSVNFPEKDCPNAVAVAKEIINIPTYYSEKDMEKALNIIREAEKK